MARELAVLRIQSFNLVKVGSAHFVLSFKERILKSPQTETGSTELKAFLDAVNGLHRFIRIAGVGQLN
jgi:hypothetical protein